jgi:hypothetical protein
MGCHTAAGSFSTFIQIIVTKGTGGDHFFRTGLHGFFDSDAGIFGGPFAESGHNAASNARLAQGERINFDTFLKGRSFTSCESSRSKPVCYPKIGVYTGTGSSYSWLWFVDLFDRMGFHDLSLLDAAAIQNRNLGSFDVLAVSGGDTFAVAHALGPSGARCLKGFIDYWAIFIGMNTIGITGLILWFPEGFTRFLPGVWVNIAQVLHFYEAILAIVVKFFIHIGMTHLRPAVYPADTCIFTGRTSNRRCRR